MFERWVQKMRRARIRVNKARSFERTRTAKTGESVKLQRADNEDILVRRPVRTHTKAANNPKGKERAVSTPRAVATPLPPLNFSQMGKICPRTAANATRYRAVSAMPKYAAP